MLSISLHIHKCLYIDIGLYLCELWTKQLRLNFWPASQLIRATHQRSCCSSDDVQASNIMLMCTHSCINCFSIKVPSILLAVCLINVRIVYLWERKAKCGRVGKIRKDISGQSIWPPSHAWLPRTKDALAPPWYPWHFSFAFHFLTLSMSFASIKCVCAKTWKLSFECFNYTPS